MARPGRICLLTVGLLSGATGITSGQEQGPAERIRSEFFAQDTCRVIEEEAFRQKLPASFFARLVWRESLFSPSAVSAKGAQGIAQFLPGTAAERGLKDPFEPASALVASARYLADLRKRFGSLGLAAAAYNAGPTRVGTWLKGDGGLPIETQDYVHWITGHSAEGWSNAKQALAVLPIAENMSFAAACRKLAARGLTAKLPDKPLRAAAWQKMFAERLGIRQVKASKPGRVRIEIDIAKRPPKNADGARGKPSKSGSTR